MLIWYRKLLIHIELLPYTHYVIHYLSKKTIRKSKVLEKILAPNLKPKKKKKNLLEASWSYSEDIVKT